MESWKGRSGGQEVRRVIRGMRPGAEKVFKCGSQTRLEPINGNPFFDESKIYQAAHKTKTEAISLFHKRGLLQFLVNNIPDYNHSQFRNSLDSDTVCHTASVHQDIGVNHSGLGGSVDAQLSFKGSHNIYISQFNQLSNQFKKISQFLGHI